jgi:hypothetical protein
MQFHPTVNRLPRKMPFRTPFQHIIGSPVGLYFLISLVLSIWDYLKVLK